jgi:hypothetical protein
VGILFRGWIYKNVVAYKSVGLRNNYPATDGKLFDYINLKSEEQANPDIEQIINLGLLNKGDVT